MAILRIIRMQNITIALRTSSFSCVWFHDFPVFMSAEITHLSNPFKSEAVLTSLWMSNLFLSQFSPSPLCFVKKKKKMAPSTEKTRQFMCRYRCRYMQSYFCFSSDHVDTLTTLTSNAAARAWQTRGICGSMAGRFDHVLSFIIHTLFVQLVSREGRFCNNSVSYQRLLTTLLTSLSRTPKIKRREGNQ